MVNWLKDILGSVIFIIYMSCLLAGVQVIASLMLAGTRAVLGLELGIQRVLAGGGCVLLGAVLGGLSLGVYMHPAAPIPVRLLVNLVVIPAAVGLSAQTWGRFRRWRQRATSQIDTFAYGFLFALTFGVVRILFQIPSW
jgi:uncharacterized membrane protein